MTHALTIARRDLTERFSVFIAAALLSTVPFILTMIPGMPTFRRTDVITTAGGLLSVGFTLGLAIVLGVTMIGRDLTEKRMSFYFSKPISASAIWFGKLAAAILTLSICFLVLFLPAYLASSTSWNASWNVDLSGAFGAVGIFALLLMLFGHVLGTMFRSKSPLVALDVALMVVTVLAVIAIVRPLLAGFAVDLTMYLGLTLLGALVVILIGSGAWQLSRGRADRRQNHIALSTFVWVSLAVVLAGAGAYSAWVTHVSPKELKDLQAWQPDHGTWSVMFGKTRHRADYHAAFAYDLASGHTIRLGGVLPWRDAWFSRDGGTLAYILVNNYRVTKGELFTMPLRADAKPFATGIQLGRSTEFSLSDDGSRAVVIDGDQNATVYELASKRALFSAKLPVSGSVNRRPFFLTNDLVRIYVETSPRSSPSVKERTIDAFELDAKTRTMQHTGNYHALSRVLGLLVSADGRQALVNEREQPGSGEAFLVDGRTLQKIVAIPAASMSHMTLLADGSVASVWTTDADHSWLNIYAADGAQKQHLDLGSSPHVFIGGELTDKRLLVVTNDRKGAEVKRGTWSTRIIDYTTGREIQRADGLRADTGAWAQWFGSDPRHSVGDADRPLIAYGKEGAYSWHPLTGEKKLLVEYEHDVIKEARAALSPRRALKVAGGRIGSAVAHKVLSDAEVVFEEEEAEESEEPGNEVVPAKATREVRHQQPRGL